MTWGAVAGAGISAVGGLLGSKKPSAPKFRPNNVVGGLLGDAKWTWNKKNDSKDLNLTPSDAVKGMAGNLSNVANNYMSGASPTQDYQKWAFGDLQGNMPGFFGDAMASSAVDPYAYTRYDQQMGGAAGNVGGIAGQMAGLGMGMFNQGIPGQGMAMNMYGQGMGLLNERPQSYQAVADQQLAQMRAASAPYEERAGLGLQQNLFNTGRLGTKGGSQNIQDFATGLGNADLQRVLQSQGFAEQLYGRDQQAALARNQMGYGMMNSGLGSYLQGAGLQQQGYGIGANMLGNAGNMFGLQGNMYGAQFEGAQGYNEMVNARAMQRLAAAQGMFGFGNTLNQGDIQTGGQAMQNFMGLDQGLQAAGRLGAQQPMQGGSPGSGPNAAGSFLQGLGGAVGGMDLKGMLGGYDYSAFRNGGNGGYQMDMGNYGITPIAPSFGGITMPTLGG